MANYQTLKKAIEALIDPGYDKTLKEVEGLKKLTIGPTGVVDVIVALKHIDQGYEQEFKLKLTKLVKVQYKFPGIKTEFVRNDFLPKGIRAISQGKLVAESLKHYIERHPEIDVLCTKDGTVTYFTTDSTTKFIEQASIFLNEEIVAKHVDL